MLNLPVSTEFNKKIPKEKFYAVGNISVKDKEMFVSDIEKIIWKHKLSERTANIVPGADISEIEVIYIQLRNENFNLKLLQLIQKLIPYAIVFALEYQDKLKLSACYNNTFFQTEWKSKDTLSLELKGLNLDAVWENIIVQIGGMTVEKGNTLDEQIAVDEEKAKLQKEIARLEKSARNEKQPKKKFILAQQIKKLKEKIYEIRMEKS